MIRTLATAAVLLAASAAAKEAPKPLTRQEIITRAEALISEQGYAAKTGTADSLVRDPFDPPGKRESVLAARKGTLEPKAVGARLDSGMWFVGFRSTIGGRIRGVVLDETGTLLKFVSQNMQLDWLSAKEPEKKILTQEEAAVLAVEFAKNEKRRDLSKKPAKIVDNKGDTERDRRDSWWVYFETGKPLKKGRKQSPPAIVSIHKISGEAKWVDASPKP